jgi:opacity protein-like surface antigen
MKNLLKGMLLLSVISLTAIVSMAQDERNKVEWFGGYSYLSTDTGLNDLDSNFDNRLGSHGFETSITGNFHRYVGVTGDLSYNSKSESFVDGPDSVRGKFTTTQFLGGLQFKDNKVGGSRLRPFAHVLAGVAHQSISATGFITPDPVDFSASTNNFAVMVGAGLDVNASRHVAIRVVQADYNPIFFRAQDFGGGFTTDNRTQNNFRVGFGIVIH